MLTQTAIRSDAFHRSVPPTRNVALAATKVFDGASERKPLGQSIYLMGAAMSYPRNAEIYGENELAEYLYKVISGAVRTYKILSDGRRQIGGFYLGGTLENAAAMASHASTRTTQLYARRLDEVSLDEVERNGGEGAINEPARPHSRLRHSHRSRRRVRAGALHRILHRQHPQPQHPPRLCAGGARSRAQRAGEGGRTMQNCEIG
jgi:hypothetical protein